LNTLRRVRSSWERGEARQASARLQRSAFPRSVSLLALSIRLAAAVVSLVGLEECQEREGEAPEVVGGRAADHAETEQVSPRCASVEIALDHVMRNSLLFDWLCAYHVVREANKEALRKHQAVSRGAPLRTKAASVQPLTQCLCLLACSVHVQAEGV